MDTCSNCGARVTPALEWCGQCLHAIPLPELASRVAPWLQNRPEKEPPHRPTYSRWHGGPTWVGPLGRILMTIGVMLALPIGYPMLRGLILATVGFDIPGRGLLVLWLAVAIPGAIFLLTRVWRRARVA